MLCAAHSAWLSGLCCAAQTLWLWDELSRVTGMEEPTGSSCWVLAITQTAWPCLHPTVNKHPSFLTAGTMNRVVLKQKSYSSLIYQNGLTFSTGEVCTVCCIIGHFSAAQLGVPSIYRDIRFTILFCFFIVLGLIYSILNDASQNLNAFLTGMVTDQHLPMQTASTLKF